MALLTPPISPADPSDWPAVAALLQAAGLPLDGAEANIGNFLIARLNGRVVWCAGLEIHGEHGLLRSVAVSLEQRGAGLGQRLVAGLLTMARQHSLVSLTLLTETAADFFPRFGFEPIARGEAPGTVRASAEFQGACPESAVVMILHLKPAEEVA